MKLIKLHTAAALLGSTTLAFGGELRVIDKHITGPMPVNTSEDSLNNKRELIKCLSDVRRNEFADIAQGLKVLDRVANSEREVVKGKVSNCWRTWASQVDFKDRVTILSDFARDFRYHIPPPDYNFNIRLDRKDDALMSDIRRAQKKLEAEANYHTNNEKRFEAWPPYLQLQSLERLNPGFLAQTGLKEKIQAPQFRSLNTGMAPPFSNPFLTPEQRKVAQEGYYQHHQHILLQLQARSSEIQATKENMEQQELRMLREIQDFKFKEQMKNWNKIFEQHLKDNPPASKETKVEPKQNESADRAYIEREINTVLSRAR